MKDTAQQPTTSWTPRPATNSSNAVDPEWQGCHPLHSPDRPRRHSRPPHPRFVRCQRVEESNRRELGANVRGAKVNHRHDFKPLSHPPSGGSRVIERGGVTCESIRVHAIFCLTIPGHYRFDSQDGYPTVPPHHSRTGGNPDPYSLP